MIQGQFGGEDVVLVRRSNEFFGVSSVRWPSWGGTYSRWRTL